MDQVLAPLRFEPFLRPMIWGGRALATLNKSLADAESYGESWEVSDHALHRSVVAEGPWARTTLRQLMEQRRSDLLGSAADRFATFPWLIKFLDCHDLLSVQVHPDSQAVKTLWPGEGSKTEAWYVIHAEPTSRVYAGLRAGVGPMELRRAVANGTVADCLHSFTPQAADCVFLPAGTVHAVGGGVLMAEIQETSDATFRLFDWNRVDAKGQPRKLHIEEAFAAIHWDYGPVQPVRRSATETASCTPLVRCTVFELEHLQAAESLIVGGTGRLQSLLALSGRGRWPTGEVIRSGQVWLAPATQAASRIEVESKLEVLVATLP